MGDAHGHLPFREGDLVGADALENLPVQVVARLGVDATNPELLQQHRDQDAGLDVTQRHEGDIVFVDAQVLQHRLVGRVGADSVGNVVRNVLDYSLRQVNGQHFVAELGEGASQVAAKSAQSDYGNVHRCFSTPPGNRRRGSCYYQCRRYRTDQRGRRRGAPLDECYS